MTVAKTSPAKTSPFARPLEERLRLRREVKRLLSEGASEDEIKSELALSGAEWAGFRRAVFDEEAGNARRPPIEVFVEYQLRQLKHISELEEARQRALKKDQPQHAISAIKAKSELFDRIIQKGQELGVYHREGQKLTIKGAMGLVHMTPKQLAEHLDRSFIKLQSLSEELGRPLELDPISQAIQGAPSLRLVEPPHNPDDEDEPEVEPDETVEPEAPESEPDAVPTEVDPEITAPERRRHWDYKNGDGDPGPEAPIEERVYRAAMEPKAGCRPPQHFAPGEIVGDKANIRRSVFVTCPHCDKRVQGEKMLTRHLLYAHQLPQDEAERQASAAIESERMSIVREYVAKLPEGNTGEE
jgi:hypothetical protein